MNKIFNRLIFTSIYLVFTLHNVAQNNLRLLSANGSPFKVMVNNKAYQDIAQAEILVENILKDTLTLKFEFENKQVLSATLYLLNKGISDKHKEYYYFVNQKEGELKLEFKSISEIIDLPKNIVPKKPIIDTSLKNTSKTLDHLCEIKTEQAEFFNNLPKSNCKTAMPEVYLQHYFTLLKKAQKADEKLYLAQELVKNNCLNLTQLKTIINSLDVEFDKLTVSKLGYFNLVDTNSKNTLINCFKYDASIKDMSGFLKHVKDYKSIYAVNCESVSDENMVAELIHKLSEAGNDSYRLDLLKKSFYNYCYSISQISKILETYTHDRERLQACKLLYFKCAEKPNYQNLSSSFEYPQHIKYLNDFIKLQSN